MVLNCITPAESLLSWEVTCSQVLGGRTWVSLGAVILPPTRDAGTCDVQVDQPRQSAALTTPRGDSLSLRLASVKPRQVSV